MNNILIPNTELSVSPFGLGTVDAGLLWDGADADRVFETYLELGGNLLDSAHVYSDWVPPEIARSERVIGDWLARSGKRDKIVLITKGGHPDMTGENPDTHMNRMHREDMVKDLDESLKQLRTDYIDLYFYHRDDVTIPAEETIEVMQDFVKQGKIRYYGWSNWSTERMMAADKYCAEKGYRSFAANQALLNLGYKYMNPLADDTMCAIDGEMQAYHKNNPGNLAMPYMGVCSGFFHIYDSKGEEAVKNSPYYTEGNLKMAKRMAELKEKYNATITQIVLGFFTVQDFPCVPLYGAQSADTLAEAAGTFEISFDKEDYIF